MKSTSVLRLFVSLNPTPEIVSRLRDQQTFLRQRLNENYGAELSVRWTKPTQFHLTLLFLGNLFWQQLEWIREQIAETVAAANTLPTLQLSGFGCFPVFKSPRILWIGVEPQAQLHTLQTDLLTRLSHHPWANRRRASARRLFGTPKAFGWHRCTAERSVEDNVGQSDAEPPGPAWCRILLPRGVRCKE